MKFPSTLLAGLLAITFVGKTLGQQETGDLKILFKYKGEAPKPQPLVRPPGGAFCGAAPIPDERLIVNPKNNGIKNVVVFIKTNRRGPTLGVKGRKVVTLNLNNRACKFEPHVLMAQVGDTINVNNPDPVGHNANFGGFTHEENFTIPAGQFKSLKLVGTEPTLIPVSCNIHPWMKAHLLVVDHAFFGISNEKGELSIKGIPAGEEFTFQAWHETGTFSKKLFIDGKQKSWSRSRMKMKIKQGMNDVGTVEMPPEAFQP